MFRIGDKVRIRPYLKIKEIDTWLRFPEPSREMRGYCGRSAIVTYVGRTGSTGIYYVRLNITGTYDWYNHEIDPYKIDNNFISLDPCL